MPLALLYFPLRARAESIRMIARYREIDVVDEFISFDKWSDVKPTMPKGQVPVLRLEDGTLMPESVDIAAYLATLPTGTRQLVVDDTQRELYALSQSRPLGMVNPLLNWFTIEQASPRLADATADCLEVLRQCDARLVAGAGPFLTGSDRPGVGDLGIFHCVNVLEVLAPTALADFSPAFSVWKNAVASLPGVREYLSERPKCGTGAIGRDGTFAATRQLD